MTLIPRHAFLTALCVLSIATCTAQNTTRPVPRVSSGGSVSDIVPSDSTLYTPVEPAAEVAFDPAKIVISGYDKRVSDYRESFFVTNGTPYTISRLGLALQYETVEGSQLHAANRLVNVEIPPGATRKVDISGFDSQKRYYYYKSKAPTKGGNPFKVTITVTRYDIIAR